jgi:hypothetical protein
MVEIAAMGGNGAGRIQVHRIHIVAAGKGHRP